MFYFLQPVWMFAAAGVIIPIIIHLWNVQRGRVLKVGSVILLTQNATKSSSIIKLHQLLLLALRCLLIILLAALLAQPIWVKNSDKKTGWVLIDKNDFKATYARFKAPVDSLLGVGYELHYFNNGFEKTDINTALNNNKDSATATNYWNTIRQLTGSSGAHLPLYVFTKNSLINFTGNRPAITNNIYWHSYMASDSSTYVINSYDTGNDSLRVVTANSSAAGTINSYTSHAKTQVPKNLPVNVDTSTLYVSIYAKNNTDAAYVKAAITAIQQFSKRKISLAVANNTAQLPRYQDWLFWLSDDDIPEAGFKAQNIFLYVKGELQNMRSVIAPVVTAANPITLYKRIKPDGYEEKPLWKDGFGNALLTTGFTSVYRFYSRFDVGWNDLPWSNQFSQMLYALLYPGNDMRGTESDKRAIAINQMQPYTLKQNGTAAKGAKVSDMTPAIWLAAFIIFFIERFIAARTKKRGAHV